MDPGDLVERNKSGRLALAGFMLDLNESELLTPQNQPAPLRRQALEVLLALGRRAGRVVPKDALMREVWPGVVVGDDSLVQAVAEIRRVLGDTEHRMVRTVARRGYMLTVDTPVEFTSVADPPVAISPVAISPVEDPPGSDPPESPRAPRSFPMPPLPEAGQASPALQSPGRAGLRRAARAALPVLAAAALLAVSAGWVLQVGRGDPQGVAAPNATGAMPGVAALGTSLIVLPLEHAGGQQAWFADALTTDLTTSLAQIGDILVIGRGTARTFQGRPIDPRDVARDLGVRYVVRGSVRRDDERVRLDLSMVDGATGTLRWSQTLDIDRADLAKSVDDVTGQLARALTVALFKAEGTRTARLRPDEVAADDLAMRGFGVYLSRVAPETFREARGLFEQALAKDPNCIRALAGLSMTSSFGAIMGWMPDRQAAARVAEETLARLEHLDAERHLTLLSRASIANMKGDWDALLLVGDTLVERFPNEPTSHHHRCSALLNLGRFEQSLPACQRAIRISPRDSRTAIWFGLISMDYYLLGRYPEAVLNARRAVTANAKLSGYWMVLAAALARDQRRAEGEAVLKAFLQDHPGFESARVVEMFRGVGPDYERGLKDMMAALHEMGLP